MTLSEKHFIFFWCNLKNECQKKKKKKKITQMGRSLRNINEIHFYLSRFLLQCLEDLDRNLRKLNSRLFVIRGQPGNLNCLAPAVWTSSMNHQSLTAIIVIWGNDHEIEFQEIESGIFQEFERTIWRSKFFFRRSKFSIKFANFFQ